MSTNVKKPREPKKKPPMSAIAKENFKERMAVERRLRAANRAADKLNDDKLKAAGGRGTEILASDKEAAPTMVSDATVPDSVSVVNVLATVEDRTIAYLAMGIVLRAIKKGLMQSQTGAAVPFYCFRYLTEAFTSCMKAGTSLITEAPLWYWEIFHALKPKQVAFKTGSISYAWNIRTSGISSDDNEFALGSGPSLYAIWWGTGATTNDVNGFPILGPSPPYTDELGLAAMSKLWGFFNAREVKLVPDPGMSCTMYNDTSAFAVVYPELGATYFSVGAFRTTIYSERHIDTPLLAKFAEYQPNGTPLYRGWQKAGLGAGSASAVGPAWLDSGKLSMVRNKFAPTVKFYNFDEIFETLSLTLAMASENLAGSAGQTVTQCPLTCQEAQILLRQAILPFFNNDMYQDLRYDATENVIMLPFTVGPNGSSVGTVDMLLPTFLAENIRCMKSFSARVSKKFDNAVVLWHSVLGRPPAYALPTNYQWGIENPLYTTLPDEVSINIIDASAPYNQSIAYLDLTRTHIQQLKETWNTWITKLSSVLSPLVSVTGQKGVRALNCNLNTLHAEIIEPAPIPPPQPTPAQGKPEKRKSMERQQGHIGTDINRLRLAASVGPVGTSYFSDVGERRVTSVEPQKPVAWPFLSKWILPVSFSDNTVGQTSYQAIQTFLVEPSSIGKSSAGGIGTPANPAFIVPDSYSRHLSAAQIDVKAFASFNDNELIQDLKNIGEKGRGGFFSGVIADLVGSVAPDFAQTAKVISSALPW